MLSNEKRREMKIFSEFYEFNERLIVNMKYGREKLSVVAKDFGYVKRFISGEKLVYGDGERFLKNYLLSLGTSDALTQLEYLNGRRAELAKYKKDSEEAYKKYGSLYIKLCLLAGLLVAVLLS